MQDVSPGHARASARAVFLSYASEDVAAAERIATSLRDAGIDVWFDQSELRGGEAWDASIRKRIKTCALFVPVISANAHARAEGYFRLEWKLAIDRSYLMASDQAFLLPVAIDDTPQSDERIPDRLREVQWSSLPAGKVSATFIERLLRVLAPQAPNEPGVPRMSALPVSEGTRATRYATLGSRRLGYLAILVIIVGLGGYFALDRFMAPTQAPGSGAIYTGAQSAATRGDTNIFTPPAHSIAVLSFVNMSGDKEQEYFSDGLTEEILNSLARINELQVAARTSAFSFKGKDVKVGTVGRELNVGAVLEGSVRRSARTVRITAQLINTITGFHLWSQTYDRDLGDILKVQTEIADAVAGALKVRLLGDTAAKIELGGTHDPNALDAYLRGLKASSTAHDATELQRAIDAYTEAARIDPNYALALASRSIALSTRGAYYSTGPGSGLRPIFEQARTDAQKAISLAPELADGHLARASVLEFGSLDFAGASEEYQRAMSLAPGNAQVAQAYGRLAVHIGHVDTGIAAVRHAVLLDPLNPTAHRLLTALLYDARRFSEAIEISQATLTLDPENTWVLGIRGIAYYSLGEYQSARATCEKFPGKPNYHINVRLALSYHKLGKQADAEAALEALKAAGGDAMAYQYTEIYAQWGNTARALDWLETALRLRDPGLSGLRSDPLMDPLRKESRYQAVDRALKFPI